MSNCSTFDKIRAIAQVENSLSEPSMKPLPEPRKRPVQARSQQTVEVILEATARVLAERGYAGTNTNLVAARAGVSVGSIYQYFPNKDALVTALHARHAAQRCAMIEDVLGSAHPRGLSGHIEAVVHALLAAHRLEPALHKVLETGVAVFRCAEGSEPGGQGHFRPHPGAAGSAPNPDPPARPRASHVDRAADHGSPGSCGGDRSARSVRAGDIERSIVDAIMGYLLAPPPGRLRNVA